MPEERARERRAAGGYGTIPPAGDPWLRPGLAVVLDMDGVIVDSNPVHREAWRVYNRRFGIETTEAMQQRMYGRRNDEIVRDFFGLRLSGDQVAAHGAAKERLYRELMRDAVARSLVPGVREFLERHAGLPAAVASNAEPANVEFVLGRAGLRPFFQAVVDGHQVERPKPAPDIYLRAAQLLRIAPADCIVFEDSFSGVEAARAAGARVVGIRTTHHNLPGAELCVDNFLSPELESWLRWQKPQV
ncbi:MAG TPA: beta-phosphoglucomutase family hydrolase [Bryobacteraceae bacterium]|nr:beta-phosphoglucomutase family hydrolase [Bryobacteraceae bacterium]